MKTAMFPYDRGTTPFSSALVLLRYIRVIVNLVVKFGNW
jgi:hypothetical protein